MAERADLRSKPPDIGSDRSVRTVGCGLALNFEKFAVDLKIEKICFNSKISLIKTGINLTSSGSKPERFESPVFPQKFEEIRKNFKKTSPFWSN